jgi:hypothetical protein
MRIERERYEHPTNAQEPAAAGAGLAGGDGCLSTRSKAVSMHAHAGALLAQIFINGRTDEGSSKLPARTTVNCGRADELAKSCEPHRGQKRRMILLPLSAVLVNSLSSPAISSALVETRALTDPLGAKCWQSRHQQTRVVMGSAVKRKLTAPQRQRPLRAVISASSVEKVCVDQCTS